MELHSLVLERPTAQIVSKEDRFLGNFEGAIGWSGEEFHNVKFLTGRLPASQYQAQTSE